MNIHYTFDDGNNLIQSTKSQAYRLFVDTLCNKSVDQLSYDQDPDIDRHFDPHGNQLNTGYSHLHNSWDFLNQLQTTLQPLENGYTLTEYNTFGVPGQRTKKVSEINDPSGNTLEIRETLYEKGLEYHTLWQGTNLEYDGESVTDNGQNIAPANSYQARRIRQNHRQLAQEIIQDNQDQTSTKTMAYYLDNHLDSCELLINEGTQLESYQSFDPFGNTVETFGDTQYKTIKYSGETKDQTGLYNYGFRSYLPDNFRWTSPDPAKQAGSGLNRYAMVGNNPVTNRDEEGLKPSPSKFNKSAASIGSFFEPNTSNTQNTNSEKPHQKNHWLSFPWRSRPVSGFCYDEWIYKNKWGIWELNPYFDHGINFKFNNSTKIKTATEIQAIVGALPTGLYGPNTIKHVQAYQRKLKQEKLYFGEINGVWDKNVDKSHEEFTSYERCEGFNCTGFAFRDYSFDDLESKKAILRNMKMLKKCEVACTPYQYKFYLWEFQATAMLFDDTIITKKTFEDFHMIGAQTNIYGQLSDFVMSKNGRRPIKGPKPVSSWIPRSSKARKNQFNDYETENYLILNNKKETCFCSDYLPGNKMGFEEYFKAQRNQQ